MWHRVLSILKARNREFYRDKAGLGWNIIMPVLLVFGFAFIFRGGNSDDVFKVGVLKDTKTMAVSASPFLATRHITFIETDDLPSALQKVERHQLDLLLDLRGEPRYWLNEYSNKGYLAERLLQASYIESDSLPERQTVTGQALRYVTGYFPACWP